MPPNAIMVDLNIPSSHPSSEEVNQHQQEQPVELNPTQPPPSPQAATQNNRPTPPPTDRKPRGRPIGSRNKPKPPVLVPQPTMNTVQLEILPNCDIVDMVEKFARKHQVGLHVLNGSGCISSFILRDLHHPPITVSGVFNLVSATGTIMNSEAVPPSDHGGSRPWLAIFVGGYTWQGAGGAVVSKAVAANNVVLNAIAFKSSHCYRLSPVEFAGEVQQSSIGGNGGGVPTGAGGFGPPDFQLNWPPPAASMSPVTVANHRAPCRH